EGARAPKAKPKSARAACQIRRTAELFDPARRVGMLAFRSRQANQGKAAGTMGFLAGQAPARGRWMALAAALLGWMFDGFELSVFTYAVFTGLCGATTTAWQIGALRFVAALGMGGEWSLGVALVMEVWPNRSRAFMAGLIGAAANVGYLLVGLLSLALAGVAG